MEGKMILTLLFVTIGLSLANALDGYQGKCTITEGAGLKVDSCDASKFLSCQSTRCMCMNSEQLYDYRYEAEKTRSKRGLKKKIAIGAGAGAVGFIAGNAVAKSSSSSGSSSSRDKKSKYNKVYSCYGRVSSPCLLDYNNVVNVVPLSTTTTTTTTTTATPNTETTTANGTELINGTSTTTTTTTQAPTQVVYDITKISKCVRNAICTRPSNPSALSGGVVKTDTDPRIGTCTCAEGYKSTNTDQCEKSGSSQIFSGLSLAFLIIYTLSIGKIMH